ncbi:hypothetical protein [Rhabdothermincola salaria]|uniref:hypothetical protein n=1 Tax=Rhabdothermincola salaria TaxID=2903142 RepID=UPI001E370983|nr:hypothetical protein [Rhabdothermincola salaria]MCD9624617.1 hypothetical protein [Rhabdothermincola salaria]
MTSGSRPVRGPSWSAVAPDDALTAEGAAARLGAYCWVEQRLFGLLGAWAGQITEPDAKAMVAEHAEHAAWRALRWHELLPTAPPGADALVVAPSGVDAVFAALSPAEGADRTAEKLAAVHRCLLPRLLAAYTAHLDWADPLTEASTRRHLEMATNDLVADLRHGERLLEALVAAPERVAGLADLVAGVEAAVVAAGGIVGPGSVGERSEPAP